MTFAKFFQTGYQPRTLIRGIKSVGLAIVGMGLILAYSDLLTQQQRKLIPAAASKSKERFPRRIRTLKNVVKYSLIVLLSAFAPVIFLVLYEYPTDQIAGIPARAYKSHSCRASIELSGKDVFILSIDGGGVFGIIPTKVLMRLEQLLNKTTIENNSSAEMWSNFQVISGVSTGAIITAALVTKRREEYPMAMKAGEIYNLYMMHANDMFHPNIVTHNPSWISKLSNAYRILIKKSSIYDSRYIKDQLRQYLGGATTNQALTDFLIPFYSMSDHSFVAVTKSSLTLNNSWFGNTAATKTRDMKMLDAVMYSLSAPVYFSSYVGDAVRYENPRSPDPKYDYSIKREGVDGGLYQANPVLLAIAEARRLYKANARIHVLSLGTGISPKRADRGMDEHGAYNQTANFWDFLPLSKVFLETSSIVSDGFLSQDPTINYTRIDGGIPSGVSLDMADATQEHLKNISEIADQIVHNSEQEIERFAESIIASRSR